MADLGRFQRGQSLTIAVACPSLPDAPPVVTITDPDGVVVMTLELPWVGGLAFARTVRLGALPTLGIYPVVIAYAIAGTPTTPSATWELVGGGDSGGAVISMFCYDRPEARYVVAQLGSGRLVRGRNPHL